MRGSIPLLARGSTLCTDHSGAARAKKSFTIFLPQPSLLPQFVRPTAHAPNTCLRVIQPEVQTQLAVHQRLMGGCRSPEQISRIRPTKKFATNLRFQFEFAPAHGHLRGPDSDKCSRNCWRLVPGLFGNVVRAFVPIRIYLRRNLSVVVQAKHHKHALFGAVIQQPIE